MFTILAKVSMPDPADLAIINGVDVDFPRNLAKSVTTE
jgi:hypothetical protein